MANGSMPIKHSKNLLETTGTVLVCCLPITHLCMPQSSELHLRSCRDGRLSFLWTSNLQTLWTLCPCNDRRHNGNKEITAGCTVYIKKQKRINGMGSKVEPRWIGPYTVVHCVSKNDTDVTHYRFNPHQPILVILAEMLLREYGDLLSYLS